MNRWSSRIPFRNGGGDVSELEPIERKLCIGLLLTGGNSSRFGSNKLLYPIGKSNLISLVTKSLVESGLTTFEAGRQLTNFPQVPNTVGNGPLNAIANSYSYLLTKGEITGDTHILVLAGDLPLITAKSINKLARWKSEHNVIPVINSHKQFLCARWSPPTLQKACDLIAHGVTRASEALDSMPTELVTAELLDSQSELEFYDVDTRDDLQIFSYFSDNNRARNRQPGMDSSDES